MTGNALLNLPAILPGRSGLYAGASVEPNVTSDGIRWRDPQGRGWDGTTWVEGIPFAPALTVATAFSVAENVAFNLPLIADQTVTWAKTGGADGSFYTLSGATVTLSARDFETPLDDGANNTYVVELTATGVVSGLSTRVTITGTVTNVLEGALPALTPTSGTADNAAAASTVILDLPALVEGESRTYIVTTGPAFALNGAGDLIRSAGSWSANGTATGTIRQSRGGVNTDTPVTIGLTGFGALPTISGIAPPVTVGVAYDWSPTLTDATSVSLSGTLLAGLSIEPATGRISGTATEVGSINIGLTPSGPGGTGVQRRVCLLSSDVPYGQDYTGQVGGVDPFFMRKPFTYDPIRVQRHAAFSGAGAIFSVNTDLRWQQPGIRFAVTPYGEFWTGDGSGTGKRRSEHSDIVFYPSGVTGNEGEILVYQDFRVMGVPAGKQWADAGQLHATKDAGDFEGSPMLAIDVSAAGKMRIELRNEPNAVHTVNPAVNLSGEFNYALGERVRLGIACKPSPTSPNGYLKVWKNGVVVIDLQNIQWGYNDTIGGYWKWGVYCGPAPSATDPIMAVEYFHRSISTDPRLMGSFTAYPAQRVKLPTPVLIEGFDAVTGFTNPAGAGMAIDTVNKIEGTGSAVFTGKGALASNIFDKALGSQSPATWGVVSAYVEPLGDLIETTGIDIQFLQGATIVASMAAFYNGVTEPSVGRYESFAIEGIAGGTSIPTGATTARVKPGMSPKTYAGRIRVDGMRRMSDGMPTVGLTFDDTWKAPATGAVAACLDAWGINVTYYPAVDQVNTIAAKFTWELLRERARKGDHIGLDGRRDDGPMTGLADEAAVTAEIAYMRQKLFDNGLTSDGWKDICYPFGYHCGDAVNGVLPVAISVSGVTSSAAAQSVLTWSTAANVQNGMVVYGLDVPEGTKVLSGGGSSVTTVTVDKVVPAAARLIAFHDESAYWQRGRMQRVLAAAGIRSARVTAKLSGQSGTPDNSMYTRMGIPNALWLSAQGMTGGSRASLDAMIDNVLLKKTTQLTYMHNIAPGVVQPSTDFDSDIVIAWINEKVGPLKAAGNLATLTVRDIMYRDEIQKALAA